MEAKQMPQPKTYGPLRNLPVIDKEKPMQSLMKMAEEHGEIFRFEVPNRVIRYLSGHRLVKEACDESKFDKNVSQPLKNVRAFTGDGLFTSWTHEENWHKAHNILLPSFSQQAMKGYHSMMVDIAVQLIQKWERLNPDDHIEVPEDMTRLTLDTIGLCGFNYRFNSFYQENPHPFIQSMVRALEEAMKQLQRLGIQDKLMVNKKRQFEKDKKYMFELVDKIISERKESGFQKNDLLTHMLNGVDPETGEALDDENIRYQIITFLIAGHETTSGLLSFALYYLVKNPEKLKKAAEEAEAVLIDPVPGYKQVKQLKYIGMVLNEALRLWPTAPAFSLYAKDDVVLGGDYPLNRGDQLMVLIPQLHRDRTVWGDDVEDFKPERFENLSNIPQHAFKPFGNGQRACIGQQFALHEAKLILGMMLKHFDFIDHLNYQLDVKETLTLKPDGFTLKVRSKHRSIGPDESVNDHEKLKLIKPKKAQTHGTPLLFLYGSNMGTAEGTARDLADIGMNLGFETNVAQLDAYMGNLPSKGAVVIVTSSYNGTPPDNAKQFVKWLEEAKGKEVEGIKYAVFGCGDSNWATTYQRIPQFIDSKLSSNGAYRICERGEADASDDFEATYEAWRDDLWESLAMEFNLQLEVNSDAAAAFSLEYVNETAETPIAKSHRAFTARVIENRELQAKGSNRSTRHIEVSLPSSNMYKEGDHLGIIPQNDRELVERVMNRFHLEANQHIRIHHGNLKQMHLPLGRTISIFDLLTNFVELQEPATRSQLRELAAATECPPHKKELEALTQKGVYKEMVLSKRISMLDLLEKYPAVSMDFAGFLALLPGMKPRYYSISSSPKVNEDTGSITVSVVRGNSWSGNGEYKGVASNYLAQLDQGDTVTCFLSSPESGFELPESPETPIIMVGPGTGIAPFRGFIQARSAWKREGKALGKAHLYFGCRHSEFDFLYRDELEMAVEDGIIILHTAYSRMGDCPKTYVQHLIEKDGDHLIQLLDHGGHLYICGDGSKMAPDVENTLIAVYGRVHSATEEESRKWLAGLERSGRYAKDVWAGQ
ncbi:bifunctional cytochrome P450/NADPH--P450 reductase [Falsibacillus albus]|uniref:Bifunctional cytochrome P450/NADPH--P450 reductase n=1 Tax=Falsibacillus albus TaxID=2478915 RepID=A0A3L7JUP2_9BACI|nr:bifunctional cytochrome P450/NADPH--P450 reductase [Falsibacillus albus]RLQ94220.1 cytochrome P450 [Falsibacillus albus]